MNPYSLDLRTRVAAACQEPGAKKAAVARRFDVSRSFVKSLVRQQQQTGSLAPNRPVAAGPATSMPPPKPGSWPTWRNTPMLRWPS